MSSVGELPVAEGPAPGDEPLLSRADVFLCLARAFQPPPPGWSVAEWSGPLLEDLQDLSLSLGLDLADLRRAVGLECARWSARDLAGGAAADPWLVEYSRLFLVPPVPVPLNTGAYLDGALGGSASQMAKSCYEAAGFSPSASFHDLPDHVAMQLEFVGSLWEQAARGDADAAGMATEFGREFLAAWIDPLHEACTQAAHRFAAAGVYRELAALVRSLVARGAPA